MNLTCPLIPLPPVFLWLGVERLLQLAGHSYCPRDLVTPLFFVTLRLQ